ncbi:MAG TPA: hypothetical protein VF823_12145 [Anaerolineales bacterium]
MSTGSTASNRPVKAGLGRHIVLDLDTSEGVERLEFDVVPDEYADFSLGFLGAGTPLARAIEGLASGQQVPYRLGNGRSVRIISVATSRVPPPKYIAARRQATVQKAVDQSDRTNAMIFASSFSGKWGDYDPSSFVDDQSGEKGEAKD